MLCPPTSSQAALEEKMNVWGMLIRKTTLGGNSSQPTYLPHTGLHPELQPLLSCSHPQSCNPNFWHWQIRSQLWRWRSCLQTFHYVIYFMCMHACMYPVPSIPRVHDFLGQWLELLHFNAPTKMKHRPANFRISKLLKFWWLVVHIDVFGYFVHLPNNFLSW